MRLRNTLRVAMFVLLAAGPAVAQSTSATVSGLVLDPSGRPIAGADIEMVNDATGVRYPGATNGEGIYEVPNLPPGSYRLQVAKPGFKTLLKPDIVLRTEDALAINFTLPVGATMETVTVEGGGSLLETQSAAVSTVIDRQFVENLPLNGRSFNTLLQLTPGVVIAPQPSGTAAGSAPGQFSISGARTDANSFMVDGVSANFGVATHGLYSGESGTGSDQAFSALGGTSSLVSVEALQEFRIETSSFAPEFGRTPGGQVMLTTRSGTNDLHGGVYEYFRNDVMDANDWFASHAGEPRAAERHNDFGGFLGGPLVRNRTFYFFSYEGARLRLPQTTVTDVPYLNNTTCAAPAAVAPLLEAFPRPNGPVSSATCTGLFTGSYSNSAALDATSLRVDHTLSSRLSLFGRYNYAPSLATTREYALTVRGDSPVNTQTGTLGMNLLLSRFAANTLRANYSSQSSGLADSLSAIGGATLPPAALLLGSLPAASTLAGFQTYDTNYYAMGPVVQNRTRQINLVDNADLSAGTHQLKFGVDYRALYLDKTPYGDGISMNADTVGGLLAGGTVSELELIHQGPASFATDSTSLYAQDTWRLGRRLVMTYGLRWELDPAPTPRNGTRAASWTHTGDPALIALAPFGTPLWQTTWGNLAPRLGLAWRPRARDNLVIRGGIGLFYDLGTGRAADAAAFYPNSVKRVVADAPLPVSATVSDLPALSTAPPYPLVNAFSSNLRLPRSLEWNLAVEKALPGHQIVTATYVGQHGQDQLRQEAEYRPNPSFASAFLLTDNSAWSNYNALELQYRANLPGRLQALVNYTWSHSLDNASSDVVAGPSNTVISEASDYASSAFDVRSSFSGALTCAIPPLRGDAVLRALTGHWSLAAVTVARSGFPFNGLDQSLSPATGGYAFARPDLVPGQPLWIRNRDAGGGKSLNPAAFSVPLSVRQGSEGRDDIPGFDLVQTDFSLGRTFPLVENWHLQFQADAFNALNHPNFANPLAYLGYGPAYLESSEMLNNGLGGLNPLFQEGGPRSLQLSLKLSF